MTDERATEVLEIFWRPGCPFCYRLLHALESAQVRFRLHNIWEDDTARAIVAGINGGNETVPTVVIGGQSSTNPKPKALIERLRSEHPGVFAAG